MSAGSLLHHHDLDDLAGLVVVCAYRSNLGHAGMHCDDLFDLVREDIEAGDHDDVLLSVGDSEVAALVHEAHVAGAQPAIGGENFLVSSGRFQYPRMTCGPRTLISPTSPTASSLSRSSRMVACVDGIGMPMAPVHSSVSSGLAITTGEASVNPYPSMMVTPVRCFQRSATARCTAMPPALVTSGRACPPPRIQAHRAAPGTAY